MKPIQLKVAGLNSFREEQTIDFSQLCQGGVFGIFGPTGSGKSSLLDAITLALYGRVERAANNTQGIMNHAEDQLSVSFTFELRNANGVKRYRVERRMKRSDEVRVRTVTSRFVEIKAEGDAVLADKDRDVTKQVEEILGLTADDFTRAVVLPQGRFAEFLSLKGAERRQMLQRLFHLEQYGDFLNMKLRKRVEDTRNLVSQIEAEQLGLGEAGEEHVKQAKERVILAEKEAELCRTLWEKGRIAFEEGKSLRTLQEEMQSVEKELKQLAGLAGEMLEVESRLHLARQSDFLRPYGEALEKAGRESAENGQKYAQARQALEITEKEWKQRSEEYAEHSQMALEEEPRLTILIQQLQQGLAIKRELDLLLEEIGHLKNQEQAWRKQAGEKAEEKEKALNLLEKAIQKQASLQEELKVNQVSTGERERIQTALQKKMQILDGEKGLAELEREWKKKDKEIQDSRGHLALFAQSRKEEQVRIGECLQQTESLYHVIREWENRLQTGGEALVAHSKKIANEIELQKKQHLALQLAEGLKEGQPCPVCGSTAHPILPQEGGMENVEIIGEQLQLCQELQGTGNRLFQQYRELSLQLDLLSRNLYEWKEEDPVCKVTAPSVDREEDGLFLEEVGPFTSDPSLILEVFQKAGQEIGKIEHILSGLQQRVAAIRQDSTNLIRQEDQWKSRVAEQEKALLELQEKRRSASEFLRELKNQWFATFAGFSWDKLEEEGENIRLRDQRVEELHKRLQISEPFIEQKNKEIQALEEARVELERNLVRIHTEIAAKKSLVERQNQSLKQISGENENMDAFLQDTKNKLAVIKTKTSQLTSSLEASRNHYMEKQKEEGIALQSVKEAGERKESAERVWEHELLKTDFTSLDEVKRSLIPQEEQKRLSQVLEDYKNQERKWQMEGQRVRSLLKGRSISDDEWNTIQSTLEQTKKADEKAHVEKIRGIRDLEDVERRHKRWLELEKERKGKKTLLDRLLNLQQVLRGNAFVEFIAEEQLMNISYEASARLGKLTRQRYALEVDSSGGFVIRDDANGGVRRPVSTLSGGETFLTSLSLALALSSQIQLRGEYPLEFFFLDEGFGTLDQELLDTVVSALEKLHSDRLAVGIISHVPELRARLPRRLIVEPAEPSGRGSVVKLETF